MEKEPIGGRMAQFTKEASEMDCFMVKESGNLRKMTAMKVNTETIKNTAKGLIDGAMA